MSFKTRSIQARRSDEKVRVWVERREGSLEEIHCLVKTLSEEEACSHKHLGKDYIGYFIDSEEKGKKRFVPSDHYAQKKDFEPIRHVVSFPKNVTVMPVDIPLKQMSRSRNLEKVAFLVQISNPFSEEKENEFRVSSKGTCIVEILPEEIIKEQSLLRTRKDFAMYTVHKQESTGWLE